MSPLRDLREKYGKTSGSGREVYNLAIREEIPGGSETLDSIELFYKILRRHGDLSEPGKIAAVAYERLLAIASAMEDEIRRRYNIGR
jgi:hypothetical protein